MIQDMSIKELDIEIKKHESEIENLEKQKKLMDSLTPAQNLAIALHEANCHHNHTDGCSWYYGNWENWENNHARKEYVERAERLLATGKSVEEIIEISKLMNGR